MKIAIVIENAFGYAGTEKMCNFMTQCLAIENDITVYSLKGEKPAFYPYADNINIVSLNTCRFKFITLIKELNRQNYDFIFLISMGKLSVLFSLLAKEKLTKRKVISCEHISLHSFSRIKKWIKIVTLKSYKKVVVLTERDLKLMKQKGINAVQISNPVHYHHFVRETFTGNFVAIGRLEKQKGYERMFKIWNEYKKNNPLPQLHIAGDGSMMESLQRLAIDLGIETSVHFLGQVKNIEAIYKQNDVLIMTSHYEGMPLALLEAKSWSMPAIAFNCPTGPQEIITDGIDGFLVDDGDIDSFVDKMKMVSNEVIYKKLSKNCYNTSTRFSHERIMSEWKQLILS